jgi:hypothetical protein
MKWAVIAIALVAFMAPASGQTATGTGSAAGTGSIAVQPGSSPATPASAANGAGCPINTVPGGPVDAVTAYNCPLPNPTGSGNLLVALLRWDASNSPAVTFTDNVGGNAYQQATVCTDGSTKYALYYAQNVRPGVNVVTAHFSANSTMVQEDVFEFYNVAALALDQAACHVATGSAVSSGALPALAAANDLILNFAISEGTALTGCTPGSQANISWVMRMALVASPEPACGQYGVRTAATGFSPAMTFSTSAPYISVAAAFKAASAGTPPPAGIRVAYVQHDDGSSESSTSFTAQLPISGNMIAELWSAGCLANTLSSCPHPTAVVDGTNTWIQVGSTYVSTTLDSGRAAVGAIFYAKGVAPGLYPLNVTMSPAPPRPFPLSWIMYDIVGASTNPLDLAFGGNGDGLAKISTNSTTVAPIVTFTAAPSFANGVILAQAGFDFNTFTGLTSPVGSQFLAGTYIAETNFSWEDLNGGWGLFYNGASLAAQTWTWAHDNSNQVGSGRGLALGAAFH